MEITEKIVAMRLTFALLATLQVEGLPERLGQTYTQLKKVIFRETEGRSESAE
jgi:hypothetical protein